jgi:3-hydroxy-9,10-secoandrosta-1,3,5(10)-triene-9,17-dione monooxygenase
MEPSRNAKASRSTSAGSDIAEQPPDFSGTSCEQALERAHALVPALRERAQRSEAARSLAPETVEDLHSSGLLRILQPKRWGGMELEFVAYVDVAAELARGCASTSWNQVNLVIHHWLLALFDERAQADVWDENPEALIAAAIAFPQGHGRRVEGGFVISGRWNFSSSVDIAQWNLLAVTVRDGDKIVDHRMCLLHRSQYEVIDDWQVMGMRATGSMTVVAKDIFVPEYRTLCMYDVRGGDGFPGARTNPNPLYRIPMSTLGAHGIGGTAVGNAQAALDCTIAHVKQRSTSYTGMRMRDLPLVQLRMSAAAAKIDMARLILRNDCFEGQAIAARNVISDPETKLRFKRNMAYAGQLCTEAVDSLHALAGANGIYAAYPLERIFRDAHTLAGHIMLSFETWATSWGLAALGGEVNNPTL